MSSRIPMSMALIASVSMTLGMPKEAKAQDIAAPATEASSVLSLSADDIEQLNQMGFDPQAVEQEIAEIEEAYGPVDPRTLQREVSQDMQRTVGNDYMNNPHAQSEYIKQLRERYEDQGKDPNRARLIIAESDLGDERLRLKGIGLRYEREF